MVEEPKDDESNKLEEAKPETVTLVVGKDTTFGIYDTVSGYHIFLEKGNMGKCVNSKCVQLAGNALVFEVDVNSLLDSLEDLYGGTR